MTRLERTSLSKERSLHAVAVCPRGACRVGEELSMSLNLCDASERNGTFCMSNASQTRLLKSETFIELYMCGFALLLKHVFPATCTHARTFDSPDTPPTAGPRTRLLTSGRCAKCARPAVLAAPSHPLAGRTSDATSDEPGTIGLHRGLHRGLRRGLHRVFHN